MWDIRSDRLQVIDRLIEDARAGRPRVLSIEGAAGLGKSSHLRGAVRRATGFRILEAGGEASAYRPPFAILHQFGVDDTTTAKGSPQSPSVAAQGLRRLVDEESKRGPVVLAVDDLQWADAESVESLYWLVQRAEGDRLLVVVASRPLGIHEHVAWQRFHDRSESVHIMPLEGIGLEQAADVLNASLTSEHIAADDVLVERLWTHTAGNPLYLRSLALQYSIEELRMARELPAPVEVARDLNAQLQALDPDAAHLLRAVAVTGASWLDPPTAAAVAQVADPGAALSLLLENGLLIERSNSPIAEVRVVHALIRAAIYQSIPVDERRVLHLRAALAHPDPMVRLEHNVAAADRYDEELAGSLERGASEAHGAADYRRAAQLLTWSSQISHPSSDRERRWLEAQLETIYARDVRSVRAHLSEVSWASDVALRSLVIGTLLVFEKRVADARRLFMSLTDELLDSAPAHTRDRLLVLTAWTILASGYPTAQVRAVLDRVEDVAAVDPALRSFYFRVAGQVAGRDFDVDHLQQDFDAVPREARLTPLADTGRLGWRGSIYSMCGFAADARRDLSEVVSRIRGGLIDAVDGVDHGLYAFALWQDGEFERASIEMQAALDTSPDGVHPLLQPLRAFVPIVRGELDRADSLLAEAESTLRDLPWREAVAVLSQAQIARLHAGDDVSARASYLSRFRSAFGPDADSSTRGDGAIWQLHMAIARIWAGESDSVDLHLTAIETDLIVPDWSTWSRPWLEGLAAEQQGNLELANRRLDAASILVNDELPLYRAHLYADFARVAARDGDAKSSAAAQSQADTLYARLGAVPYLSRNSGRTDAPERPTELLAALSDREREVASLILAGLSYAQIAQDLYVTRSTVGYHLGNIYAKTGVNSRHALTELARSSKY